MAAVCFMMLTAACVSPEGASPTATATVTKTVTTEPEHTFSAAPPFSVSPDESKDRLAVESAANNADWDRLTVEVDACSFATAAGGNQITLGGASTATHVNAGAFASGSGRTALAAATSTASCGAPAAVHATGPGGALKMRAGDRLEFCGLPSSGTPSSTFSSNVKVVVKDMTANVVVYIYTFLDVRQCTS